MSDPTSESKEPAQRFPLDADGYTLTSEIGVGAFATVYSATVNHSQEQVAIKILNLEELNTNWQEIRNEINTMRQMQHPNVVKIHCTFVDQEELWIVMPMMAAGSAASVIKRKYKSGIKNQRALAYILLETLKAIQYIHKDGKVHRDIKAGNILLSQSGDVYLADFGVAGALNEQGEMKKKRNTFVGTPCWMAPEVMEQQSGYNQKADIWSFGITAMELAYGRAPYATFPPMKVLILTLQEDPPTCDIYKDSSYEFPKLFHKMIAKCLRKSPNKRPTAEKLLQHKFFKDAMSKDQLTKEILCDLPPLSQGKPDVTRLSKEQRKQQQVKPVTAPSWIFEDIKKLRRDAEEEDGESDESAEDAETKADVNGAAASKPASQKKGRFVVNPEADNGASKAAEAQTSANEQENGAAEQSKQVGRFTVTD